ncbi:MAG: hypothetical protein KF832_31945 [Caldilineaceae bacterium]|nr:hypothetical protein [Caldilineaceae bacterium]
MLNFPRSTFTWKSHPWWPDEYYRYPGGFVGTPGQVYQVRFNIEASCTIRNDATGQSTALFVGAPCRTEYTIASRNLFQVPSAEFRFAWSHQLRLSIAKRPSTESEVVSVAKLSEAFQEHRTDLRHFADVSALTTIPQIVEATLANDLLNAVSTYRDPARGLTISVEYPVNLINVNAAQGEFQVCTGPVIVPDLATWDGQEVQRVFLAHVAFTAFDHVEFILQREVAAAPEERTWLDQPRGRDRLELLDPNRRPPHYPPPRPKPTVYNEIWALPATNVILRAPNP